MPVTLVHSARRCRRIVVFAFFREERHELHLVLYLSAAGTHISRRIAAVELARIRQSGGYESTLGTGELLCSLAEVVLGNCLSAIDAVAHLYRVKVDLHDAMLAPQRFN